MASHKQEIADRLWFLLETYPPFAAPIRAGARIKENEPAGWLRKMWNARLLAGYPRVELNGGRYTSSGYTVGQTFATEGAATFAEAVAAGSVIRRTCEFRLTLTALDMTKVGTLDDIEDAAQTALLFGGPGLGLPFVLNWGPAEARREDNVVDGDARRPQSIITIPVVTEIAAAELI